MSITLGELKTQARQRADMTESSFVEDAELTSYINNSIAELYDLLIQSYGSDYYISQYDFTTVSGQKAYDLPSDFYKLRGVDANYGTNNPTTLDQFNFNERNRFTEVLQWNIDGLYQIRYRLRGSQLLFSSDPDRNVAITLWYIPLATKLVDDADTMDDLNAYSEYVIVDAAIKMMQKEESDVSVLMLQKEALKQRIESASQNRDAGSSESVSDVYNEASDYFGTYE